MMLCNYLRAVGSLVSRSCIGIHFKGFGSQTEFFAGLTWKMTPTYRLALKKRVCQDYMGNAIR